MDNMTDHVFHSLITDKRITDRIAGEVLADMGSELVSLDDVKEALQRYQQKICFEYVKIIGADIDVQDLPFS